MTTATTTKSARIPLTFEDGTAIPGATLRAHCRDAGRFCLTFDTDCDGEVLAPDEYVGHLHDAMQRAVGPVVFVDRGEGAGEEVWERA